MRRLLFSILLTVLAFAQQSSPPALPTNLYTVPGGIPSATLPITSGFGSNAIIAANLGITADGKVCFGTHVSWTNASNTVTTDATCPFSASDTGKKGFGTNGCCGGFTHSGSAIFPLGTLTFVNATTATMSSTSTALCNTTACEFWWFTDQRSIWTTISNTVATATSCVSIVLPSGISPIPFNLFNTASPICGTTVAQNQLSQVDAGNIVIGQGIGASVLLIPPDNLMSTCNGVTTGASNVCLFAGASSLQDFSVTGGGNVTTGQSSTATLVGTATQADFISNVSLTVYAADDGNAIIGFLIPFSNKNDGVYVDGFGNQNCVIAGGQSYILTNSYCGGSGQGPSFSVTGSNTRIRTNNVYFASTGQGGNLNVQYTGSNNIWWSTTDNCFCGVISIAGTNNTFYLDGYSDGVDGAGTPGVDIRMSVDSKVHVRKSVLNGTTPADSNGATLTTGAFFDEGGNTFAHPIAATLVPTCAMTTGGGTGPACALVAGSTNEKGTIRMTPGTTPSATGTTTLTFAGTFTGASGAAPSCNWSYANTGTGAWSLTTTTPIVQTVRSATVPVFNWNQTGALTAASTYDVDYACVAR